MGAWEESAQGAWRGVTKQLTCSTTGQAQAHGHAQHGARADNTSRLQAAHEPVQDNTSRDNPRLQVAHEPVQDNTSSDNPLTLEILSIL